MYKIKLIFFFIATLLLSSTMAWSAPPQDYSIVYAFKNPDGSVFRIIKYYQRDGDKFRTDHLAAVKYHISNGEPLKAEQLPADAEPDMVSILRKDKSLLWSMDPPSKSCHEVPLKQNIWEERDKGIFLPSSNGLEKTGETRLLDYPCNIYESIRVVKEETWTNIAYVAHGLNAILKTETMKNGALVQTMEAVEFRREKPAAALFEIPAGYTRK